MKNYTLQEMMAASFGFSQSQASKWSKVLRPLLFDTLKELHVLPTNQGGILNLLGTFLQY